MTGVPRSRRRRATAHAPRRAARRAPCRTPPSAARARAASPLTALPTQKTPYEWAGVFELQKGHKYSWIAQKTGGKYVDDSMELFYKELTAPVTTENVQALNPADYADPAMKIVVIEVPAPASDSEADRTARMEGAEADATTALEAASCAAVTAGGSVATDGTCQQLTFDASAAETTFTITVSAAKHYAIFAEHVPIEFEEDKHYIQDSKDVDVEPLVEEGAEGHAHGHRRLAAPRRLSGDCDEVESNSGTNVSNAITYDECNKLIFDTDLYTSLYTLETPAGSGTANYAFYAQHFPIEFELDSHYLKDDHGDDVEPVLEVPAGPPETKLSFDEGYAWRHSMLATFIVLLCTFAGALSRLALKDAIVRARAIIPFASALGTGALFGCAVFLMMIEGSHLVGARWSGEVDVVWRWGTAVLGGYLLGLLTELAFPREVKGLGSALKAAEATPADEKDVAVDEAAVAEAEKAAPDYAFCFNIFFGDFWHNFVDGIFIAHSFLRCESGQGWVVTAGTIYHELVQEFGDFFLLVGPGGLTVPQACAVNFLSGVSVMIGAMWYLWLEPGMGTQGILLAFSAGVYTYVACTEAAGEMLHEVGRLSPTKRLGLVACFSLGAIGIGLILLDHEHCGVKVADGEADPHAGHNH